MSVVVKMGCFYNFVFLNGSVRTYFRQRFTGAQMMSANLLCCLNTEGGRYIKIASSICPSVLSACPICPVEVTARVYTIKIWLFLLWIQTAGPFCNLIWFVSSALEAGVSCENIWLLCWRLRSQRKFNMSVNVCPDDIFWTVEHFLTKLGMFMQHHKPGCHAKDKQENGSPSSMLRSERGLI